MGWGGGGGGGSEMISRREKTKNRINCVDTPPPHFSSIPSF